VSVAAESSAAFKRWAAEGPAVCARPLDNFRVGDWVARSPLRYRKYDLAAKLLRISRSNVRQMGWVARRIAAEDRRPGLSFKHHVTVAALAPVDQRRWLDRAERDGLTADRLHALIRAEGAAA
jgi:hypothetical protein